MVALDPSFGTSGKVTSSFSGYGFVRSLAVQPDGKMLVAGYGGGPGGYGWYLARYDADGSLDSTFGTGGKVTLDFNGGSDNAWGLALTPDGKIVAGGNETDGTGQRFAVARFNPDGSLDTDFNTAGMVTGFAAGSHAYAVKVDGLGRITAAGDDGGDFALARYEPDGSLDTGFGSSGTITTDFGSSDWAFSIALTSDGGVIAAGTSGSSFALARYAPGGTAKQRLYAEQDANYNVTSLVDTKGQVVQRFAYDPYGADQVLDLGFGATTDAYDWHNRFQGARLQTATGTYDLRNRVYSPTLGQWLQMDPSGYPDGMNAYEYERSNTVVGLDPTGLQAAPPTATTAPATKPAVYPNDYQVHPGMNGTISDGNLLDDTPGPNGRRFSDGPRYGNWGGKEWSGGQVPRANGGLMGKAPPVDSSDELYKIHDEAWDAADKQLLDCLAHPNPCKPAEDHAKDCKAAWEKAREDANRALIDGLAKLDADSTKWLHPPPVGQEGGAEWMRFGAFQMWTKDGKPPPNVKPVRPTTQP